MSQWFVVIVVLFMFAGVGCGNGGSGGSAAPNAPGAPGAPGDYSAMLPAQILDGIEKQHPAAYYILAAKLFEEGKKDDAVFWFYTGQLRYRYHLMANKDLNPSGDPALFASLSEQVGRSLNEYAFGDIPKLAATIDRVLKWDDEHDNAFTAKSKNAAEYKKIRSGLGDMKDHITANEASIKRDRKAAGLD
ncbi:MAG: hypothetical protein WD768_05960 [Phycisphaeraceae bacterium]